MARASASQSMDLGSIPLSGHVACIKKIIFTAFLLGAQRSSGEKPNIEILKILGVFGHN